jgi:hypothetical protein
VRSLVDILPLALTLLALAGCGEREAATTDAPTTTEERAQPTVEEEARDARPGEVLERFVAAARAEDVDGMWGLLSQPTQRRLGPTVVRFESGAGGTLRRELSRFDADRSDVFLDESITATFAVAAFGGRVASRREAPYAAFAAALRREPEGWRLELGGPLGLAPVAPAPGSAVTRRVRLAAEVRSDERLAEAGLWLDGASVPGRIATTGPQGASMFSNEAPPLVAGPHAVVAFASTFGDASATAWVFARGGG